MSELLNVIEIIFPLIIRKVAKRDSIGFMYISVMINALSYTIPKRRRNKNLNFQSRPTWEKELFHKKTKINHFTSFPF